jgi:phage shock protein E
VNWIIIIVVLAVVVGILINKRMSELSPESARKLIAEGAMIIDVRSPEEFRGGQVPGAVNIPLDIVGEELPRRIKDKNKPLLLHCQSGMRSGMAKKRLLGLGYTNVHNLGSYSRAREIVAG